MNKTLEKQIDNKLEQYKLELQNKELIAEIQTAKETIASQNEHIHNLNSNMNMSLVTLGIIIGILTIVVAIFGVALPLWYRNKSKEMLKEMESLNKDVNDFITSKFKKWEVEKVDINIDKYIEGKVLHTEFYSWASFSSISYEQLNKIFNHGVEEGKKSQDKFNDYLKWLTFFIFTQNTFDIEETGKIRKEILSYKYFYKLSDVDDVGIEFNMMPSLTLEEKEILAKNFISNMDAFPLYKLVKYLCDSKTFNKERENLIATKVIEEKDFVSLRNLLKNNKEVIAILEGKGFFEKLISNVIPHRDDSIEFDMWGIKSLILKRNSLLTEKIEEYHPIKEIEETPTV